jgi:uncharacterized membrane protein HdeD (DUF308 family)
MASSAAVQPGSAAAFGEVRTPWWVALVAGIAMTLAGLLLLMAPGLTLIVLVQFLGVSWLVGGVVRLVSIFVDRSGWGWKILSGILGIVAGLFVMQHPLWSALVVPGAFTFYIGVIAIVLGIIEVVMAFLGSGWSTGLLGAASILLGLLLTCNPQIGAAALPFMVGGSAFVGGIVTVVLAFKSRGAG